MTREEALLEAARGLRRARAARDEAQARYIDEYDKVRSRHGRTMNDPILCELAAEVEVTRNAYRSCWEGLDLVLVLFS